MTDGARETVIALDTMAANSLGYVLMAEETFDPPTTPLDASGQGHPYAVYGSRASGRRRGGNGSGHHTCAGHFAAHDVGRAINPTLIEGQIEGGVAQGLGLALMEEFVPGRGENLHDYLIPTVGDMPPVESILIEDASPLGRSRKGHWRTGIDPDGAGHSQRHSSRHRRAHDPRAGNAGPPARRHSRK